MRQTLTLAVAKLCRTLAMTHSAICVCVHPSITRNVLIRSSWWGRLHLGDAEWLLRWSCAPVVSRKQNCLAWSKIGRAIDLGTKADGIKGQRPQVAPGELLATTEGKERSFSPADRCARQPERCPFHSVWRKQKQTEAIYHLTNLRWSDPQLKIQTSHCTAPEYQTLRVQSGSNGRQFCPMRTNLFGCFDRMSASVP